MMHSMRTPYELSPLAGAKEPPPLQTQSLTLVYIHLPLSGFYFAGAVSKEPPTSTNPELDGAAAAAAAGVSPAGPTSAGVALTAGSGEAEEKVLPKVR
jgi:hypothetical protein